MQLFSFRHSRKHYGGAWILQELHIRYQHSAWFSFLSSYLLCQNNNYPHDVSFVIFTSTNVFLILLFSFVSEQAQPGGILQTWRFYYGRLNFGFVLFKLVWHRSMNRWKHFLLAWRFFVLFSVLAFGKIHVVPTHLTTVEYGHCQKKNYIYIYI